MSFYNNITDAQLVEAIEQVVNEAPDTIYATPEHMVNEDSCYYVHTDPETKEPVSPGCVIGCALHLLGVSLAHLQDYEGTNAYVAISKLAPRISDEVRGFAHTVQMDQDRGSSWGVALESAKLGTQL